MTLKEIREAQDAIVTAKREVASDPHLANFVLRDLAATRAANLDDLAWAYHKGNPTSKEIEHLIGRLEAHIEREAGSAKEN